MISISPTAIAEIKRMQSKQQKSDLWLLLTVKSGGCSGLFYDLSFTENLANSEPTFNCNGIPVAIDTESLSYLHGLTLDYSEDLVGGGFRFHNPRATSVCGCGNSFSLDSNV
ncbi:iron-sulfur cluster assembly accessory protein [Calothrix sp. UHCC 0171]|uniref:HesB/IscA family protein n=1 Tax=Calothrix sp. UHCC 0171 TaxID=3110245 RepID=UPI002B201352|nr:iron-sulfur cluster assembly accessory protein [Calothrix sp. UHCC 0171]MEA5570235.1 iron-sulfur cluster assembly accessory protein [Calothrix sp. UHCC 0171]